MDFIDKSLFYDELVFIEDVRERVDRNKELVDSKKYAIYLEEKVSLAEEKLKSAECMAAIGQTVSMVGHDIRYPLQAIAGDLFLIDNDVASLAEGETKRSLQESVRSIQVNLLYIDKIVVDLQDFAKPLKPCLERVDFEKVIEEVMLNVCIPDNLEVVIDVGKGFRILC